VSQKTGTLHISTITYILQLERLLINKDNNLKKIY